MLALLLLSCGGEPPAPPAPAAPVPVATPATPVPPPVEVGPDGPPGIAIAPIAAIAADPATIAEGEQLFAAKGCGACHAWGSKLVGPDLTGVTTRRTTPWVQRMIADPDAMTKQDPVARDLFRTHMVQMPKQGVTDAEMPKLLAFIVSKGK